MTREIVSTPNAPAAIGPYSQAVKASGNFLFMSGSIPLRPDGSQVDGDVAAQTAQVLANMEAILNEAGVTWSNIVKTTIFLSSMDHFATVNELYGQKFPANPPARSTVAVLKLPRGVDVEIEAIAVY